MTQPENIELDNLVESFSSGFGRVTELLHCGIGVKYPHREKEVYYSFETLRNNTNIKIHVE